MTTKNAQAMWIGVAVLGATFAGLGCSGTEPMAATDEVEAVDHAVVEDSLGSRIERALRDIEMGTKLAEAHATLEEVLRDPSSTSDQRDDARLGISRYHELQGDKDAAIRVVEELLASHRVERRFAAEQLAQDRLRLLLTGSTDSGPHIRTESPVAPIAKPLSSSFTPGPDGTTHVQLLVFGRSPVNHEELGTFNISGALQDLKREACPLCSDSVSVNTSRSQTGSWVSIPAAAAGDPKDGPTLDTALTVFYYDLESNRIPSRYDRYLPLPSDEIAARLEKGEGLVAVKARDGAPAVVVIAAPRWAMLGDVEKAFAEMKTLPTEPVRVELSRGLRPQEIKSVVRSAYPSLKKCYDAHLAVDPDARGKLVMSFVITPEGRVADLGAAEDSTLTDGTLRGCFETAFGSLSFPATGSRVTVKYPIMLSPDQD